MASAAEMANYLNRQGLAALRTSAGAEGEMRVPVQVLDARERFGGVDLLVEPVRPPGWEFASLGRAWVSRQRVELVGDGERAAPPEEAE